MNFRRISSVTLQTSSRSLTFQVSGPPLFSSSDQAASLLSRDSQPCAFLVSPLAAQLSLLPEPTLGAPAHRTSLSTNQDGAELLEEVLLGVSCYDGL